MKDKKKRHDHKLKRQGGRGLMKIPGVSPLPPPPLSPSLPSSLSLSLSLSPLQYNKDGPDVNLCILVQYGGNMWREPCCPRYEP